MMIIIKESWADEVVMLIMSDTKLMLLVTMLIEIQLLLLTLTTKTEFRFVVNWRICVANIATVKLTARLQYNRYDFKKIGRCRKLCKLAMISDQNIECSMKSTGTPLGDSSSGHTREREDKLRRVPHSVL